MLALLSLAVLAAGSLVVSLTPQADTTLYSEAENANGGGRSLFVGVTANNVIRRSLLLFDVSALPAGIATVQATLTLQLTRTIADTSPITVHRLLAPWSEGSTVALGQGGPGAPAAPGDCTWTHRVVPSTLWSTAGGDYVATASASLTISASDGPVVFPSSAGLLADIELWRGNSSANYGWILVGRETQNTVSARRFGSRNDPLAQPVLRVTLDANSPTASQSPTPAAYGVDVTAPTAGREYFKGQTIAIQWQTRAPAGQTVAQVYAAFSVYSTGTVVLDGTTANTGSISFNIPANVDDGTYSVKVCVVRGSLQQPCDTIPIFVITPFATPAPNDNNSAASLGPASVLLLLLAALVAALLR
eukprot:TRINITY_DN1426_c0_g1_i3.p1 TRINITY_DN1426_c0_g1~~TRINITY_DN1426_c0_g1_i3.p1  ORF type:complete len:374 (-),score=103.69 TRINITY_DN1426_c0_g1_i3:23-1105(-)